jgi:hypothetical protein
MFIIIDGCSEGAVDEALRNFKLMDSGRGVLSGRGHSDFRASNF